MYILGIESSCDETSVALIENGTKEIYMSLASSCDLHEKTGGVVPEVAARKQVEFLLPVLHECLTKSQEILNTSRDNLIKHISHIAVTKGPGLIGSLVVGVEAAKTLSVAWKKQVIPVNHLIGHLYANFLVHEGIEFPAVGMVVSGGHTDLILMKAHGDYTFLGGTLDDACGEAFDKTSRTLGLSSYKLGGPLLSKKALEFTGAYTPVLPRPMLDSPNFDFSFSGLKTAVKYLYAKQTHSLEFIAYDFQQAVIDVLTKKAKQAVIKTNAKSILLGGGVLANTALRAALDDAFTGTGVSVYYPPIRLCGDNAAYIASAGFYNPVESSLEALSPNPALTIIQN